MHRPSRQLNIFSISALDLFASAMGAFVIITVILFPYYMKNDEAIAKARVLSAQLEEAEKTAARHDAARKKAEAKAEAFQPKDIEVVFLCDTTASMGDHLAGIKANLKDVVDILKLVNKRTRVGFIAYKDIVEQGQPDTYVTKTFPIREMTDASFKQLSRFVDSLSALSVANTDPPESLSIALKEAMQLSWGGGNAKRIIVIITDAPAKKPQEALRLAEAFNQQSRSASSSKVTTILARTDNMDQRSPAFLQSLAKKGGGEYIEDTGRMLNSLIRATLSQ